MRSVFVLAMVVTASSLAHSDPARRRFRTYEHSREAAGPDPYRVTTYTLELGESRAQLAIEVQVGHDDPSGRVTWRTDHVEHYAGDIGRGAGGIAMALVAQDAATRGHDELFALACREGTTAIARATAMRVHTGGEADQGRWKPAATTRVATLTCTPAEAMPTDLVFGAEPGIEWLAESWKGRGLRAIPADGSIAPVR